MSESTFVTILIPAGNPGPLTGPGNNTYLLIGHDGNAMLVDAGVGAPEHLARLQQHLIEHRTRLRRVLVTHAHPDHASGAPAVARAFPGAVFSKYPWPEEDASIDVAWTPITDGHRFDQDGHVLTAVHTPGHAPDHVALWDAVNGTVYTGDLVLTTGSVMIPASKRGRLDDYMRSLERIRALDAKRLLPAHGPAIDDPAGSIERHLAHRRLREQQILDALAAGPSTVQALAGSIYDGLAEALVPAARENVRAHLDKLEAEGRAHQAHGVWTTHP